jgi:hypothetical protein
LTKRNTYNTMMGGGVDLEAAVVADSTSPQPPPPPPQPVPTGTRRPVPAVVSLSFVQPSETNTASSAEQHRPAEESDDDGDDDNDNNSSSSGCRQLPAAYLHRATAAQQPMAGGDQLKSPQQQPTKMTKMTAMMTPVPNVSATTRLGSSVVVVGAVVVTQQQQQLLLLPLPPVSDSDHTFVEYSDHDMFCLGDVSTTTTSNCEDEDEYGDCYGLDDFSFTSSSFREEDLLFQQQEEAALQPPPPAPPLPPPFQKSVRFEEMVQVREYYSVTTRMGGRRVGDWQHDNPSRTTTLDWPYNISLSSLACSHHHHNNRMNIINNSNSSSNNINNNSTTTSNTNHDTMDSSMVVRIQRQLSVVVDQRRQRELSQTVVSKGGFVVEKEKRQKDKGPRKTTTTTSSQPPPSFLASTTAATAVCDTTPALCLEQEGCELLSLIQRLNAVLLSLSEDENDPTTPSTSDSEPNHPHENGL